MTKQTYYLKVEKEPEYCDNCPVLGDEFTFCQAMCDKGIIPFNTGSISNFWIKPDWCPLISEEKLKQQFKEEK